MVTSTSTLNDLFTSGVVTIFGDVLTLADHGGMLWMNWRLALVAFGPAADLLRDPVVRRTCATPTDGARTDRTINAFLQENITGMSTVQLFGASR